MIYFLVPADRAVHVKEYRLLEQQSPEFLTLYNGVDSISFEDLLSSRRYGCFAGTYVLTHFEAYSHLQILQLIDIIDQLRSQKLARRVLNHPRRVRGRYELLRLLHARGINDHNAYRATELSAPARWPVLLRSELGHWKSPLLHTREELDRAVDALAVGGILRSDALVVEFNDTRTEAGQYIHHGAFRIGDRIVPHYRSVDRQWDGNAYDYEMMYGNRGFVDEEVRYVTENPHAAALMEIFELANIEYGRVDYALKDGRIQVWEINTNPQWIRLSEAQDRRLRPVLSVFSKAFAAALRAIDTVGG
jgi:hypothetical protein